AAAYDLFEVMFSKDLLLQVDIFGVQPILERLDLDESCAQSLFCFEAFQLGGCPSGKDSQHGRCPWIFGHRFIVQNYQVTDDSARGIEHRDTKVALCPQLNRTFVIGKELLQAVRVMTSGALHYFKARSGSDVIFKVFAKALPLPKGKGTGDLCVPALSHKSV